jgi:hypothetical protein
MVDTLQPEEKSGFPVALIAGAVIVALIVGGVILMARLTRHNGPTTAQHLPFGPGEQAAAERIHFLEPQMARASNFLNQDVTYIAGTISNDGTATLGDVEATFEFRDPFNQVILRETRRLFDLHASPLPGGQRRDFQIALEYIPVEWNQQYPQIRVTGLLLQ